MAPSLVSVPSLRRRNLLLAVIAALVVSVGAYIVLHAASGGGSSHKRHHHSARPAVAACHAKPAHHASACNVTRARARPRVAHSAPSIMKLYAIGLRPVLDQSRSLFDQAARAAASSPNLDALGQSCSQYGPMVQIAADQIEGVPHPYGWYTTVGYFHHSMMGIYHRFQGALNLCGTAVSNGDSSAATTAIADMASEASHLRAADDYVRWVGTH
jgi:hypothetical protein